MRLFVVSLLRKLAVRTANQHRIQRLTVLAENADEAVELALGAEDVSEILGHTVKDLGSQRVSPAFDWSFETRQQVRAARDAGSSDWSFITDEHAMPRKTMFKIAPKAKT